MLMPLPKSSRLGVAIAAAATTMRRSAPAARPRRAAYATIRTLKLRDPDRRAAASIAGKAKTREAEKQHGPGRGFRNAAGRHNEL